MTASEPVSTSPRPPVADGPAIFGFHLSRLTAPEAARLIAGPPPPRDEPARLIITPNISHVVTLQGDSAFRAAYADAAILTADGFPVYYWARLRGVGVPARVTGYDLLRELLATLEPGRHRLFFLADSEHTIQGLESWAERRGHPADSVAFFVPPFGFEKDAAACADIVARVNAHRTTLLIAGVGAPKSEIFAHRHREQLRGLWVLCVGEAVKVEAKVKQRAPRWAQRANLEWAWRLMLEPRRLIGRYGRDAPLFLLACLRDLRSGNR